MRKILPSITTLSTANWRQQISDIKKHGLKEIALFLEFAQKNERDEIYKELGKIENLKIPFCHIRSDMPPQELDYLKENYQTELFNIHTLASFPLQYDYGNYKKNILIENHQTPVFNEGELHQFGGICLDLAHLENARIAKDESYQKMAKLIEKFPVKANHLSAISFTPIRIEKNEYRFDDHLDHNFEEFNYILRYPEHYFGQYIALELENLIDFQLKIRDYLIKILSDKLIITAVD